MRALQLRLAGLLLFALGHELLASLLIANETQAHALTRRLRNTCTYVYWGCREKESLAWSASVFSEASVCQDVLKRGIDDLVCCSHGQHRIKVAAVPSRVALIVEDDIVQVIRTAVEGRIVFESFDLRSQPWKECYLHQHL